MNEPALLLVARAGDPVIATLRQVCPQPLYHVDLVDFARAGWRYVVGCPELATACSGGRVLGTDQISGVLCRITSVQPQDLEQLHQEDRTFAASEMNAFLRAWLMQLGGRVCNEPSTASLAGPAWHPMRWRWLANQLGVPAVPGSFPTLDAAGRDTRFKGERLTALVAGDHVIGTDDPAVVRDSLHLARTLGCGLLALRFVKDRDWLLESAECCPDLDTHTASKLAEWLAARPRWRQVRTPGTSAAAG
jgi:hypothetical protein